MPTCNPGAKYTDAEAIAAAKTDPLLLNYTQGARVYHNANQSIPHNTLTALAFNSERYDTDTIHDNTTNNERLTCKTAGKYIITAGAGWAPNANKQRFLHIRLNGATYIASQVFKAAGDGEGTNMALATLYELAVNDYVEVLAYQYSGVAINIMSYGNYSPEFAMLRVG